MERLPGFHQTQSEWARLAWQEECVLPEPGVLTLPLLSLPSLPALVPVDQLGPLQDRRKDSVLATKAVKHTQAKRQCLSLTWSSNHRFFHLRRKERQCLREERHCLRTRKSAFPCGLTR